MSENAAVEYYFIDNRGTRNGPHSEADFLAKLKDGEILPETPVWRTGEENWQPLKAVRKLWLPEAAQAVPAFEQLSASTGLGSILAEAWNFLFCRNHFWLLLAGGIIWALIESAAGLVGADIIFTLVTPYLCYFVFLSFLRQWDRREGPEFSDLFPLKTFFFLPWLRAVGASILSSLTAFIPFVLAALICFGGVAGVGYKHPELFERNVQLIDVLLEVSQKAQALGQVDELPQITVETEQDADDALPEIESAEIVFPNNASLTEELSANAEILEEAAESYAEMAEVVFESPIFWIAVALSLPFVALGIFFSIRLSFATYLPLDTELGVIESLKYSWKLTAGNFLKIFVLSVLVFFGVILGTLITLGFGLFVLYPYALSVGVVLYAKLVKSRPDLAIPPSRL